MFFELLSLELGIKTHLSKSCLLNYPLIINSRSRENINGNPAASRNFRDLVWLNKIHMTDVMKTACKVNKNEILFERKQKPLPFDITNLFLNIIKYLTVLLI